MPAPRKKNPLGLPPRAYEKHGAIWYVDVFNKWHRLGATWDFESRAKWNSLVSENSRESRLTVTDLLDNYVKHRKSYVADSTIEDFKYSLVNLKAVFGSALPDEITPAMVQRYLDVAAKEGRGTRGNREIALLSASYNYAIPRALATNNPCSRVARNPEKPRERRVTLNELDAFVEWCESNKTEADANREATREETLIAVSCELLFLCAQSKSDMLTVKRTDIDDEGIHFQRGKTRVRVCVSWSPRLTAAKTRMLALQKGTISGMYLICTRRGRKYSAHGWSSLFHRVMNNFVAQGGVRFSPHDLRAGGATALLEGNETASNTTGHRLESTLKKHYDRRLERKGKPAA